MSKPKINLKELAGRAGRRLLNNWGWKILSLVLALFLWSGLITQDGTLTREKTFSDVTINITNADSLRRNGYIIVSGLENLPSVRLKAAVPQKNYNSAVASNYNVRVDLSKINGTGEQTLNVIATNSSTYGTVTEISLDSVTVQVEEYVTRSRIPVRLSMTGTAPEGFYAGSATVDPTFVSVSGPKSLVNAVVRCIANYDCSCLTPKSGLERTAVPFKLVDSKGETIDSSLITVSTESVYLDSLVVEQNLYQAKTLVINTTDLVTGEPAEGYTVKRISAEPATVTAAGSDEVMEALDEIHLVEWIDNPIDVSGAMATISRNVKLVKPSGINYLSSDTVLVTIEISAQ